MCNEQTDICFCTGRAQAGAGLAASGEAPLAPRPSSSIDGGVTQNFRTKPCTDCADGWITQPDGYGCIEKTLCYRCGGDGVLHERSHL